MNKFFPMSFSLKDGSALAKSLIIYLVVAVVAGWLSSLLGGIALIGWIVRLAMWLIQAYCAIGLVLALLSYLKVIK